MEITDKKKILPERKNIYLIISFVALIVVLDILVNLFITAKYRNDQEASVTLELGTVRAILEGQLHTNFFLIYGMAVYISSNPGISNAEFNEYARLLFRKENLLKNIAAAPGFVIRYVFPLKNNEKVLGLDYSRIPDQWQQALEARKSGLMVLAGPLNLVQGGLGLAARIPVFNEKTGRFWGLVSAVIDFDNLLRAALPDHEKFKLIFAIRGKDGMGENGEVFYGDPSLFARGSSAVMLPVSVPSGKWIIAAIPAGGWISYYPYQWIIHLFLLVTAIVGIQVIVSRQKSRQKLMESENRLNAMIRASHDALIVIDSDDNISFCNSAAVSMFGYPEAELMGKQLHEMIILPEEMKKVREGFANFVVTGDGPVMNRIMEMQAVKRSGEIFPVERSVASFKLGGKWYAIGSVRDITDRKQAERQLQELATTDFLTGLSNRRHFLELSSVELKKAVRYNKNFSLMMIDIDHFKNINDSFGHDTGDRVLQAVSAVLKKGIRDIDISGRIGGEEFALAFPETNIDLAEKAAERLRLAVMDTSITDNSRDISITISIGISTLAPGADTVLELMKKADEMLYKAKREGRNRVVSGD